MHALGVRSFFFFSISLSTLFLCAALSIDESIAFVFAIACNAARFCRSPLPNSLDSNLWVCPSLVLMMPSWRIVLGLLLSAPALVANINLVLVPASHASKPRAYGVGLMCCVLAPVGVPKCKQLQYHA